MQFYLRNKWVHYEGKDQLNSFSPRIQQSFALAALLMQHIHLTDSWDSPSNCQIKSLYGRLAAFLIAEGDRQTPFHACFLKPRADKCFHEWTHNFKSTELSSRHGFFSPPQFCCLSSLCRLKRRNIGACAHQETVAMNLSIYLKLINLTQLCKLECTTPCTCWYSIYIFMQPPWPLSVSADNKHDGPTELIQWRRWTEAPS